MARLPSGFQELTYIESTGTQWIDTGIKPNQEKNTGVKIRYSSASADQYPWIFGAENSDNSKRFGTWQSTTTLALRYGVLAPDLSFVRGSDVHTLEFRNGNVFYDGDLVASGGNVYTIEYPIYLSAVNKAGSATADGSNGKLKIISCEITENGILVRDFVPCCRLSDGAVGMYDLVSQSFFGNSGTGSFIAGVPVLDPIIPTWGSGFASVTQKEMLARRFAMLRKLWLYRDGDECVDVTGGWSIVGYAPIASGWAIEQIIKKQDVIELTPAPRARMVKGIGTQKKLPLWNFHKIKFLFENAVSSQGGMYVGFVDDKSFTWSPQINASGSRIFEINIPPTNKSLFVSFWNNVDGSSFSWTRGTLKGIWLE